MKPELYYCKHRDCKSCIETARPVFEYLETQKNEVYTFEMVEAYTLVFLFSGKALVSCNEFIDVPLHAGEIGLWPINSKCSWKTIANTSSLILKGGNEHVPCDKKSLERHTTSWHDIIPAFRFLPIRQRLMEFLETVKKYIDDGVACPYMYEAKRKELSMIFRAYYPSEELITFFFPTVRYTHEFETFVMDNYLKMKGVREFVDLSGMNLSTFNRKFKAHFKQSPYQWLIQQKSKHIYHDLSATNKTFAAIAREYNFSDASHFNRYCKTMFGASPSTIRDSRIAHI